MFIRKKGQAALEFLMTYGWAFLVILIMVGALTYFGVLDFKQWIPNKCDFGAQLGCKTTQMGIFRDGGLGTGSARAVLTNNYGRDITIGAATATSDMTGACPAAGLEICLDVDEDGQCGVAPDVDITVADAQDWKSGAVYSIVVECNVADIFVQGEKNKVILKYDWYDTASGAAYMRSGSGLIQSEVYP